MNVKKHAVQHNACKKLAQLSKVIYAMNAFQIDRNYEKEIVIQEFQKILADIQTNHNLQFENVYHSLQKYRKQYINRSCNEFGSLYRNVKKEFINYFENATNQFLSIHRNLNSIKNEIELIQSSSLNKARIFIESSEQLRSDLHNKIVEISDSSVYQKSNNGIELKTQNLQKLWDQKRQEISEEYISRRINRQTEYKAIMWEQINQYFSVWKEFIKRIHSEKSDALEMKQQYHEANKNYASYLNNMKQKRNQTIDHFNKTCQDIENQKQSLSEVLNSENTKFILNNQRIRAIHQKRMLDLKNLNDGLKREKNHQKHQRHQLKKKLVSLNEDEILRIKNFTNVKKDQFLIAQVNLLKEQSNQRKTFAEVLQNLDRLVSDNRNTIQKSLTYEMQNSEKMILKMNEQTQICLRRLCNMKSIYQKRFDLLYDKLSNIVSKNVLFPNDSIVKKIEKLEKELNSQKLWYCNELAAKNKDIEQKHNQDRIDFDGQIETSKQMRSNMIRQKMQLKRREIDQICNNLSNELFDKQETITQNNQLGIDSYKNSLNIDIVSEIDMHQLHIAKLQARLNFVNKEIEETLNVADQKLKYDNQQILAIEKGIRQYQRYIKSSIDKIDEDYEMKIQVLQIDLNNKIENLAKLFTNEENSRGCDIIEAIRKIKTIQNQQLSKSLQLQGDKQKVITALEAKTNNLKKIIKDYQNSTYENSLKQKYQNMLLSLTQMKKEENEQTEKQALQIRLKITNVSSDISKQIDDLLSGIQIEELDYANKKREYEMSLQKLSSQCEIEIAKIKCDFEQQVKVIRTNHDKTIQALKRRIEFAKKIQREECNKWEKERESHISEYNKKVECWKTELLTKEIKFSNEEASFLQKIEKMIENCEHFYNHFLVQIEEPQAVKTHRLRLEFQSVQKTQQLSLEFHRHMKVIDSRDINTEGETAKEKEKVKQIKKPFNSSQIKDSTKVVFEKNFPIVVFPQLAM